MNVLRSAPFLPVACLLHMRIRSCCDIAIGLTAWPATALGSAFFVVD